MFNWYMIVFVWFPIFVFIVGILSSLLILWEIKDEYIIKKKKFKFLRTTFGYVIFYIQCSIPIFNLVLVLAFLFYSRKLKEVAITNFKLENRLEKR